MLTLVIMDGLGFSTKKKGNAVVSAGTPNLDKLTKKHPHTLLNASGEFVGLTQGQMGNSEVGHLNLGAGRIVKQDLTSITDSIKSGEFKKNSALLKTFEHVKKYNSNLHIIGLVSDGGVHSHILHLEEILKCAQTNKVNNVYLHIITDGRDTGIKSAKDYIKNLNLYGAEIKSIIGRVYAMDRERRWDRIEKATDMLLLGKADYYCDNALNAIDDSYENAVYDEFIEPTIINKPVPISNDDAVLFFNFRTDRARELTNALSQKDFAEFEIKKVKNLCFTCMTEYDSNFKNVNIMFPPEIIKNNLAEVLEKNNKSQLRISETTKYAHVTFFFNSGIEKPVKGEDRILIESADTKNFATIPQMRAYEITTKVCEEIAKNKYDFVLVNLSNADMIGHTGDFEATEKAITAVDKCTYMIALATLMAGGDCLITADHGNAEQMLTDSNEPCTTHTTNPVPFILASEKFSNIKLDKNRNLSAIAPTVLKLLNLPIPAEMEKPLF